MKISTKGRYALRLMLDLALHSDNDPAPLKEAAARQGISVKYLEQIATALVRAGLINSVRGAGGGYALSRAPEDYVLTEIFLAMEGELSIVPCLVGDSCTCDRAEECVTVDVWRAVQNAIMAVIDGITLADLKTRYREKAEAVS